MMIRLLGALVLMLMSASPGNAFFDDTDKIKGHYIVDVGDLQPVTCPISGKYDCLTFPNDLYKFSYTKCYQVRGLYGAYSSKGLLAVNDSKTVSMFVMEGGFGSPKLKKYSVTGYQCPDLY